jgi:RHS repeat-associated protein
LECKYDLFSEATQPTRSVAKRNPVQPSTKSQDHETGLPYYGYRYYNATIGRWLSRDPLNSLPDADERYELLRSSGQKREVARSIADRLEELTEYVFSRNAPVALFDLLGLCVPLPDSGPGTPNPTTIDEHHRRGGRANQLIFTVCCPAFNPYLATWGVTSNGDPPIQPGWPRPRPFPASWTTDQAPSGSGPCYTIIIEVPTRVMMLDKEGLARVRIVGGCCCSPPNGAPQRSDPPTPPTTPPDFPHEPF